VNVGDRRTFQVCNNIPCSAVGDFEAVSAVAQYVGQHAAIFVDEAAPTGGFTSADLESVGALFDEDLYAVATGAFGSESDVDENGVTVILFSPEVNRLPSAARPSSRATSSESTSIRRSRPTPARTRARCSTPSRPTRTVPSAATSTRTRSGGWCP
jgi:hypothetical protein